MLPRVPRLQSMPQPPALNAVGGRVFQRKTRARACGTRGGSGPPPRRYVGSTRVGGPDGREEVPDPYGRSAPSIVGSELPLLRDTWRHRTCPRAGSGSGVVGPVR